jgi:hypothetical protein
VLTTGERVSVIDCPDSRFQAERIRSAFCANASSSPTEKVSFAEFVSESGSERR